jgi:hypothetical protein
MSRAAIHIFLAQTSVMFAPLPSHRTPADTSPEVECGGERALTTLETWTSMDESKDESAGKPWLLDCA